MIKMNQVKLYRSMVLLSIIFTPTIWIVTTDYIILGSFILLPFVFGMITAIVLDIMYKLRNSRILKLWSRAITFLWVVIPPVSLMMIASHDFPMWLIWIIFWIILIYILYLIGNGIKKETQIKTKEFKNEHTELNSKI